MEIQYGILIRNGVSNRIGTSAYEAALVQSMDAVVKESLASIDDREGKSETVEVQMPTTILGFQEVPCPLPNLSDKCQLVTAEVVLSVTDEPWLELKHTLDVAIAIGRLRFNLYEVDPRSPVEVMDSFWQAR